MSKIKTKQQVKEIIGLYNSQQYNCVEIGKMYNMTNSGVLKLVKKHGHYNPIPQSKLQRKYNLDDNYFNCVDTEHKAYFLGLLYADGYNSTDKKHIRLTLHKKDIDILQKFLTSIRYNNTIKTTRQNYRTIDIYSTKISKDLNKLGCVQAKSLILRFPTKQQVSNSLLFHFIRGMWDGDGSLQIYRNRFIADLVSTIGFCNTLQVFLRKSGINSAVYQYHKNKTTAVIRILGGKQGVRNFVSLLYQNSTIFLDRKFKIGTQMLQQDA